MHVTIYETGDAQTGFRRSFFSTRAGDSPRVIGVEAPTHTIDPDGDLLVCSQGNGSDRILSPTEVIDLARQNLEGFRFAA